MIYFIRNFPFFAKIMIKRNNFDCRPYLGHNRPRLNSEPIQKECIMAKAIKKPVKVTQSTLPAKTKSKALVVAQDFEGGEGFENVTAKDVLLPRLTLLQTTSDQLKKNKPVFIKGASAGEFCDVALNKILPSPLSLIPCFYAMIYLEWAPRGSEKGLIRNYGADASIMEKTERDDDNKNVLKNGNYIAETATYFSLYQDEDGDWVQCFLPLASAQLRSSKRWMTKLRSEKIERADGTKFNPSIFYRAWIASPTEESNSKGDWFGWSFEPADPIKEIDPSGELLAEAKEFCRQAKVGLVRGDVEGAAKEAHDQEGTM